MKKPNNYPNGTFTATIKNLRKKEGRYTLTLEISEIEFNGYVYIDIHDSICETAGKSNLSISLIHKIHSHLPSTIRIYNTNGYWKIENQDQLLSDAISRAL